MDADRMVAQQPLVFKEDETSGGAVFNRRKMSELPYHLTRAKDVETLKREALCNFRFIYEKTRAMGIDR